MSGRINIVDLQQVSFHFNDINDYIIFLSCIGHVLYYDNLLYVVHVHVLVHVHVIIHVQYMYL